MEFIDASIFTKYVYRYLSDDEYLGLQGFLLEHPEAGKVVPGSGGVRKIRWAISGKVAAFESFITSSEKIMKSGC